MRNLGLGTNAAVFFLFFGLALLDAVQSQAWIRVALWIACGVLFLWADATSRQSGPRMKR